MDIQQLLSFLQTLSSQDDIPGTIYRYQESVGAENLRTLLAQVRAISQQQPTNPAIWLAILVLEENPQLRQQAAQQVLRLKPDDIIAQRMLEVAHLHPSAVLKGASPLAPQQMSAALAGEKPSRPLAERADKDKERVYEMLWDCEYCGSKALLGKTHRFCPHCGGAQNPAKRYFPSDEEKVAVEDHIYYGADVTCAACETLNSAAADFCMNCGTPLSEGEKAQLVEDEAGTAPDGGFARGIARDLVAEKHQAEMKRIGLQAEQASGLLGKLFQKGRSKVLAGGCVLLLLAACAFMAALLFWNKDVGVQVVDHSWEREIEVMEFQAVSDSDWCDDTPSGAYDVSRSRRQRDTRRIPDGETCRTVRTDNGDGTFREREQCTTNYREEPVYDDYCSYKINRWEVDHTERASGDLNISPAWPALSLQGGSGIGAEKEGDRVERYIVHFRDVASGESYECEFDDEATWRSFELNSRWSLSIGVIAGDPECDTLARQSG